MPTIRDYGLVPGHLPAGPRNAITDVPGVLVGHTTVSTGNHHTGVTVILPREDVYTHRCTAAAHVINGFGKTAGLVQIQELGQLESPIALTNTLNVGLVYDALVQYTADACAARGNKLRSFNPVVGECNDGTLSDITDRVIGRREVYHAIETAGADFAQGCVGAGTGMICHELKGGIGSASRLVTVAGREFHIGVLALCNHGQLAELNILGRHVGEEICRRIQGEPRPEDKGSCILVLATDLPLSSRQLGRVCRRCAAGLARVGSYWGHGSGDITIGFTTAHDIHRGEAAEISTHTIFNEDKMDPLFLAAAEAAEESVLNALAAAVPMVGYDGTVCHALSEFADLLG